MSLHFTVPSKSDDSECMKRLLNPIDYKKFDSLNPKEKMFFENICLQSYKDINVLLNDCIKLTKQRQTDK